MKVILAGYSKTGTKSMCQAFNILGYNTYDVMENAYYLHKEWVKMITVGETAEDFRRMYEGVDAVTDLPCYFFWEQLHEAFPDAKIILTLRDEDEWYRSFVKQMDEVNKNYLAWFVNIFSPMVWRIRTYDYHTLKLLCDVKPFPGHKKTLFGETLLKKMYREHNHYVQQKAPKDQLLVYKVTDGWEPLCKFLEEEIPDKPFPYKNKGANIMKEWHRENEIGKKILFQGFATFGLTAALGVVVAYRLYSAGYFANSWNLVSRHACMVKEYLLCLKNTNNLAYNEK